MYRNIDVTTEFRKIADSKPVHAAAGAGVVATQTLKDATQTLWDLSERIVRLGLGSTTIVTTLPARATDYVMTARSRAVEGYETLADKGKRVINGRGGSNGALNGKSTTHTTHHSHTASDTSSSGSGRSTGTSRSKSK